MDERRQIKLSFLLMQVLQFTAITVGSLSVIVRDGDEATLSCEDVMTDQDKCNSTTWLFSPSRNTAAVGLVELGQIGKKAKAKSDRLSVTADCSLVIKNVTVEDAGQYTCRHFNRSGRQQGPDSLVYLFVVSMTEHKDTDKVKLSCSVSIYDDCKYTVKWLFEDKVISNSKDLNTSVSTCLANLTASQFFNTSKNRASLKCEVTDTSSKKLFPLIRQSSDEKAGWWWYIIVALGLAVLLVTVVALVRWKMMKAYKEKMGDNIELTRNSAVTPETSHVTVDPEDGVSYATVSYTKKTNSKARVQRKRDEDVTYSTVKASSSSAGASNDLSNR